ncbi:putative papain-like cysteine peptidase superfamily [Arabidopsis thaliana]
MEIDAMIYLFMENTSLRRLNLPRVGFMNCMFTTRIKNEHGSYLKNKKSYKWDSWLISYVNSESPSYGKTEKDGHWISIEFMLGHVESFACVVPRILKEVHAKVYGKVLLLTQYKIVPTKVPPNHNRFACDRGVYELKYIECKMLQISMDWLNDENIKEARMKIAMDLWEASRDPILIQRMKNYAPPFVSSDMIEID